MRRQKENIERVIIIEREYNNMNYQGNHYGLMSYYIDDEISQSKMLDTNNNIYELERTINRIIHIASMSKLTRVDSNIIIFEVHNMNPRLLNYDIIKESNIKHYHLVSNKKLRPIINICPFVELIDFNYVVYSNNMLLKYYQFKNMNKDDMKTEYILDINKKLPMIKTKWNLKRKYLKTINKRIADYFDNIKNNNLNFNQPLV